MKRWQVLAFLAKRHSWKRMAEIGVFAGKTSRYLLTHCPALEWIGVDHWTAGDPSLDLPEKAKKRPGDHGYRSYASFPLTAYRAKVEAMAAEYPGRAAVIALPSAEAAKLVEDSSLCAVFIDGDHTAKGVETDIRAWTPKLKPDGLLTGHDWNMPSVASVLERMAPGWRAYEDSVWSIEREHVKL